MKQPRSVALFRRGSDLRPVGRLRAEVNSLGASASSHADCRLLRTHSSDPHLAVDTSMHPLLDLKYGDEWLPRNAQNIACDPLYIDCPRDPTSGPLVSFSLSRSPTQTVPSRADRISRRDRRRRDPSLECPPRSIRASARTERRREHRRPCRIVLVGVRAARDAHPRADIIVRIRPAVAHARHARGARHRGHSNPRARLRQRREKRDLHGEVRRRGADGRRGPSAVGRDLRGVHGRGGDAAGR